MGRQVRKEGERGEVRRREYVLRQLLATNRFWLIKMLAKLMGKFLCTEILCLITKIRILN